MYSHRSLHTPAALDTSRPRLVRGYSRAAAGRAPDQKVGAHEACAELPWRSDVRAVIFFLWTDKHVLFWKEGGECRADLLRSFLKNCCWARVSRSIPRREIHAIQYIQCKGHQRIRSLDAIRSMQRATCKGGGGTQMVEPFNTNRDRTFTSCCFRK